VLRGLHEGRFDGCLWANPDTQIDESPVLREFSERLLAAAPLGLDHVAYVVAGGAEANEKALRIARLQGVPDQGRGRRRVLAFDGSFHGRTFVSLAATSNPAKRKGVDLPGYEALFCPRSLEVLAQMLAEHAHELYAVLIEPMMAEGGDIHLARDFVLGVRELTRQHGLPLIADEVVAMGRINDSLLYGGIATLCVDAADDAIATVIGKVVSVASRAYGRPFVEIYEEAGRDFYQIPLDLHSPAVLHINNMRTGHTFSAGEINDGVLRQSFFGEVGIGRE